jgi:uncharacterized protein (TIGR03067 family)
MGRMIFVLAVGVPFWISANLRIQGAEGVDAKILAGSWVCVSVETGGERKPEEVAKQLRLTLTADRYKTELGEQVLFDSTYTVDLKKTPAQIDIIGTEGEFKGKAALGLFKLERDTLTMCYVMPGNERPVGFESPKGSGVTLVVWRRK